MDERKVQGKCLPDMRFESEGFSARLFVCNTVVVGTGAAGYNAADRLLQAGQEDILIVTENRLAGTSRNTGSDKQTYYKLSLSGADGESVGQMARTLFEGQCVDGDLALCEAALSTQSFFKLVELGVPFPQNRYGEYVGYKTDHDPGKRATSVGPYTSRQMTERLEAAVLEKGVCLLDHMQVIRILSDGNTVYGLLCLDTTARTQQDYFVLVQSRNIVYATGGPAGMYAGSVYPAGHYGASGLAFEAGVKGKNLTEWQYGLSSVKPRWNVSGTYMQVLPRMYSAKADGTDEREFLADFFQTPSELLNRLFLKGYQWPFDVRKVADGSSIIDILVFLEKKKGRKVYLDYRMNPCGKAFSYEALGAEAGEYLKRAGACFGTPYERLVHMNAPAVEFYRERGVDLSWQPLEIDLCAQHNNGGLSVDCWWQTNVEGFFAAGEVSASHGVYRPGGTALNAGQVGSTRAAQYIAARRSGRGSEALRFDAAARGALVEMGRLLSCLTGEEGNVKKLWKEASAQMSVCGAAIRSSTEIGQYLKQVDEWLDSYKDLVRARDVKELPWVYRLRDMLISQKVYLSAMLDYVEQGGKSRGSALYTDAAGEKPYEELPDLFTFVPDDGSRGGLVQEALYDRGRVTFFWRPVRPLPCEDDFFENVWRAYREGKQYGQIQAE